MKARNVTISFPQYVYKEPGHRYWATNVLPGRKIIVTCDPIRKGNFHDPNIWNYACTDYTVWSGKGERHITGQAGGPDESFYGPQGGGSALDAPAWDRTTAYNAALSKLNDKVRGDLDLAIDFAEGHQSLKMVKSITKVLDFARSGAWKRSSSWANGWLQWQYGWRPLIKDVYDVCDQNSRAVMRALTHVKAGASIPVVGDGKVTRTFGSVFPSLVRKGRGKSACHFDVTLQPRGFDLAQFGTLNPVGLAWELIPYSFVVDWFLDVGSYLKNLESALWYSSYFQTGYKSELYVYDGTEENDGDIYTSGSKSTTDYSRLVWIKGTIRYREFHRSILTSWPLPKLPKISAKLGSSRLTSAAALLRQQLDREFRLSSRIHGIRGPRGF